MKLDPKHYLQARLDGDARWHAVAVSQRPARRGRRSGETHCGKSFRDLRVGETVKAQDVVYLGCSDCARGVRALIERDREPLLARAREALAELTPTEQRAVFRDLKCCGCTKIADFAKKSPSATAGMVIGGILGAVLGAVADDDKKGRLH